MEKQFSHYRYNINYFFVSYRNPLFKQLNADLLMRWSLVRARSLLWKTVLHLRPALYPQITAALIRGLLGVNHCIVTMLIVDIKTHLVAAGGIVLLLPNVQLVHASLLQLLLQPRALRLHPWECQALDISTLPVSLLTLQLQGGAVLLLLHPGQPVPQPADDSHHPLPSSLVHVHGLEHTGHRDHVLWDLTIRPLHLFDRIVGLALSLLRVLTWV